MSSNLPALREQRFSLTDMQGMADAIAASGLFGIQKPAQAYALMLIADAEGLHPASVAQDYDVIQGRPARKTHSVLARFQQAGGTVQWHDFTERVVSGTFSHPKGGSVKIEWTIDMAERAGLAGKDNWKKTPRAMLRARCIAEGVRATYPAALGGQLIDAEAQDLDPVTIDATTGAVSGGAPAAPAFNVQRKTKPAAAPKPADVVDVEPQGAGDDTRKGGEFGDVVGKTLQAQAATAQADGEQTFVGLGEIAFLRNKSKAAGIDLQALLDEQGGLVLERLTKADFDALKAELRKREG